MSKKQAPEFHAALQRLIAIAAERHADARTVAGFLLAWWDGERLGGIQVSHLWRLDAAIQCAVLTVFTQILREPIWPDQLGYADQFAALEKQWGREGQS